MRLIDADALLNSGFPTIYRTEWNDEVINTDDIRNAPTVEEHPTTCPNCDSGYAQGYSDGYLQGKEERPTGEWIYDEKLCNWKCSNCLETPKTIGYVGSSEFMNEHFKYCNHCGAKMKGENE